MLWYLLIYAFLIILFYLLFPHIFLGELPLSITMEIRVFDRTAEIKMDEITTTFRESRYLGFSSRDLARKASKLIAGRMGVLCGRG